MSSIVEFITRFRVEIGCLLFYPALLYFGGLARHIYECIRCWVRDIVFFVVKQDCFWARQCHGTLIGHLDALNSQDHRSSEQIARLMIDVQELRSELEALKAKRK